MRKKKRQEPKFQKWKSRRKIGYEPRGQSFCPLGPIVGLACLCVQCMNTRARSSLPRFRDFFPSFTPRLTKAEKGYARSREGRWGERRKEEEFYCINKGFPHFFFHLLSPSFTPGPLLFGASFPNFFHFVPSYAVVLTHRHASDRAFRCDPTSATVRTRRRLAARASR